MAPQQNSRVDFSRWSQPLFSGVNIASTGASSPKKAIHDAKSVNTPENGEMSADPVSAHCSGTGDATHRTGVEREVAVP